MFNLQTRRYLPVIPALRGWEGKGQGKWDREERKEEREGGRMKKKENKWEKKEQAK